MNWRGEITATSEAFIAFVKRHLDQNVDARPDGRVSLFRIVNEREGALQVGRFTFPAEGGTWDVSAQSFLEVAKEDADRSETVADSLTVGVLPIAPGRLLVEIQCDDPGGEELLTSLVAEITRLWPAAQKGGEVGEGRPIPQDVRTRREEIKKLFLDGKTNFQIAKDLNISESTVRRDLAAMGLRRRKP